MTGDAETEHFYEHPSCSEHDTNLVNEMCNQNHPLINILIVVIHLCKMACVCMSGKGGPSQGQLLLCNCRLIMTGKLWPLVCMIATKWHRMDYQLPV